MSFWGTELNPFAVLLPSTTLPVYEPVPLLVYGEGDIDVKISLLLSRGEICSRLVVYEGSVLFYDFHW